MPHHRIILKGLSLIAYAFCFSAAGQPERAHITVLQVATLPPTSIGVFAGTGGAALLDQARRNGFKPFDLPSIGSGLVHVGSNEFIAITDRGPNFNADDRNGKERRIFPLPQFAPTILRFRIADGKIQPFKYIPLHDKDGKHLSGLSNGGGEEPCYESAKAPLPLPVDPGGVDPEGIRAFPDGRFLVSEEYSPSLLVVSASGEVLVRYTPADKPLRGAPYPVRAILPRALSNRRDNRGLECVALSADGKTAYSILQSAAVGDGKKKLYNNSRVSRVIRLDVSDPLNARVTGHFLMPADLKSEFAEKQDQQNVKMNDAEWIAPDKLLVLEQAKGEARVLVADFSEATNLLGRDDENAFAFEAVGDDLSKLTVKPARVQTWFSTAGVRAINSDKLEGLAILGPQEIALSNDNDFGVGDNKTGQPSMVWIVRVSRPMP